MSARFPGFIAALVLATGCAAMASANGGGMVDDTTAASSHAITCSYPVRPGESAQGILERFGKDARREQLEGEGGAYDAVVLWPDNPDKRLEISFSDDRMEEVSAVHIASQSPLWTVAGMKIGTTLDQVERLNGRPFQLYGFEWDYGGTVFDWNGGALGTIEGGCSVGVLMAERPPMDSILPDELIGERALRSDLPSLKSLKVEVNHLWISFPD